jgi:hypothetical protein
MEKLFLFKQYEKETRLKQKSTLNNHAKDECVNNPLNVLSIPN